MRRDTFTATDFAPPAGWVHNTAASELMDADLPRVPVQERRQSTRRATQTSSDCVWFRGELMQDAHIRRKHPGATGNQGQAWIKVQMMVPGGQFVTAAQEVEPTDEALFAAELRIRNLRRGTVCMVYGKGSIVVQQQSEYVIQVLLPTILCEPIAAPSEVQS